MQFDDKQARDVLYTPCLKVADATKADIQALISEMKVKMRSAGIGLAANQLGHPLQLFMMEFDDPSSVGANRYGSAFSSVPYQVFINPVITDASIERIGFWHGCLSAQSRTVGYVATYEWLCFDALNEKGQAIQGKLEGMAAVIFQHEFRHLLGSVYVDHAKEFLSTDEVQAEIQLCSLGNFSLVSSETPHLLADYQLGETIEMYSARLNQN